MDFNFFKKCNNRRGYCLNHKIITYATKTKTRNLKLSTKSHTSPETLIKIAHQRQTESSPKQPYKKMPPGYEDIKALNAGRHEKGIILRLVRKYVVPDFYGGKKPKSLDCIFHDREGERIHATIGQMHMDKFDDILIEGNVYTVVDFVVGSNRMKFKTTKGEHKILIFKCTRIFEIMREDFPNRLYEFKTISEVRDMDSNAPTFDLIGIVVCSYSPQMVNCSGKSKRLIKVVLEDIEGQTMKCSLWETYADQMMKFIQEGPVSPPGIIQQFCTTNIFRGEVELQNCYETTKLIVDQDIEEIRAYKTKYLAATGKGVASSFSTLPAPTATGKTIAAEHMEGEIIVKKLMEIQKDEQDGVFLVHATIVCVEYAKDWAYFSCKLCRKKLQKDGQTFVCNNCGISDATSILRYKLIVRVVDETDTALFLLWDKESVALIGKNAADFNQVGSCSNAKATPSDGNSKKGLAVESLDEAISKSLNDEFSTSIPKKRLKRLKQEK